MSKQGLPGAWSTTCRQQGGQAAPDLSDVGLWSPAQQHEHHMGTCEKYQPSDPTLVLLSQILGEEPSK